MLEKYRFTHGHLFQYHPILHTYVHCFFNEYTRNKETAVNAYVEKNHGEIMFPVRVKAPHWPY